MRAWIAAAAVAGIGVLAVACGSSTTTPGGTGGTACSSLSSCCKTLIAEEQPSCQEVVTLNVTVECTAELETLQGDGMCGTSGGSGTGKSTTSSTTTSGSGDCATLSACCAKATFPAGTQAEEQAACNEVVTLGASDPAECTAALTEYMTFCP